MHDNTPTECINSLKQIEYKHLLYEFDNLKATGYPLPKLPDITPENKFFMETKSSKIIWYIMYHFDKIKDEIALMEQTGISLGVSFDWI